MKNLILCFIACFTFVFSAQGQRLQGDFFGSAFLGYGNPVGDFAEYVKGGISYSVAAGYFIKDKIAVGGEYGSVLAGGVDKTGSTGLFGINIFGISNFSLKGWYFMSKGKVSPYAALGLGVAQFSEGDVTINDQTTKGAKRLGLAVSPEIGVTLGGFNITYSFMLNGKTPQEPVFNDQIVDLAVNYHRFNIGYMYDF